MEGADLELQRYLHVLFAQARTSTLVELRWRAGAGIDMHRRFVKAGNLKMVAREALSRAESSDLFVGVLPLADARRPAQRRRRCAHGLGRSRLRRGGRSARGGGPEASLGRRVGRAGARARLLVGGRSRRPGGGRAANRRLAWALGGDLQCTDAPRILRPPSTIHHGRDGVPVRLIDVSDRPPTTLAALVGGLPDPPLARPRASRRPGHGLPARDPLLAVTPERYVQVLTGQSVGRSRKVRCPLHADGTPSLHVYEDPADGWYCFGCGRGGSVYDLAAGVWDITPRGDGFAALRAGLRHKLGLN